MKTVNAIIRLKRAGFNIDIGSDAIVYASFGGFKISFYNETLSKTLKGIISFAPHPMSHPNITQAMNHVRAQFRIHERNSK